jgi:preprotein translocase subunit SecG
MNWITGILTVILVLDSTFLILLILVQLPKKEAGLGTAFGSSTTDALFGAGTGNVLTKLTKYCTVVFFVLTLSLSVMNAHQSRTKSTLEQTLKTLGQEDLEESPKPPQSAPAKATATPPTNVLITATNVLSTNVPAPVPVPPPTTPGTSEKPTDSPAPAAGAPEKPADSPPPAPPSRQPN